MSVLLSIHHTFIVLLRSRRPPVRAHAIGVFPPEFSGIFDSCRRSVFESVVTSGLQRDRRFQAAHIYVYTPRTAQESSTRFCKWRRVTNETAFFLHARVLLRFDARVMENRAFTNVVEIGIR